MFPLEKIIATKQLDDRPTRPPNTMAENQVLLSLARTMVESPERLLQHLVDETSRLCNAGSAGISLLDIEHACFRWRATTGALAPYVGNTMPRHFSPCGSVLDADEMLLMSNPVKHFPYIDGLSIPIREVLLVPFHHENRPIGTLWVVAHSEDRHFDLEDARIVQNLSQFAGAAIQVLAAAESETSRLSSACRLVETQLAHVTEEHRKLSASERDKVQFLATLTHELRNTLAPISNAAQIIKLTTDPVSRLKASDVLESQLSQMTRIIDDLLDISRLANNKLSIEFSKLYLDELLLTAVDAHKEQIAHSGQKVVTTVPEARLPIYGDEVRLRQILSNLLTNAIKYGVADGVIDITLQREASNAVLTIKDQGLGIEKTMLHRIFELFVQVDQSLEKSQGGLGIGLALVKRLVEMHHGSISAHSDGLGKGSVFFISFPIMH